MLKQHLVYARYGELTYVRDRDAKREHLFYAPMGVVLDTLTAHPEASLAALAEALEKAFGTADMLAEAAGCMETLRQCDLLATEAPPDTEPGTVFDMLREHCRQHQYLESATLELTYRCPCRCIHCYIDDDTAGARDRELSLAEVKDVLRQLKQMGCLEVLLTGGETILREDLPDILEYAVSLGMLVDLYTTGIGMTEALFDRICAARPNTVSVSLYGATPQVHDAVTRVPGSFQTTLHWLMMFRCAGVETYIKTIILQQNYRELPGLYRLAERLGTTVQCSELVMPTHGGVSPDGMRLMDKDAYLECLRMDPKLRLSPEGSSSRDLDGAVCSCGQYMLSINPYGEVNPCVSMLYSLGNVRKDRIRDIWERSEALTKIRNTRFRDLKCGVAACPDRDYCTVCMGGIYNAEQDSFVPTEENCIFASAMRQRVQEQQAACNKKE